MIKDLGQGDWVFGANSTEMYQIGEQIGKGGFGTVHKLLDQSANLFVIKILRNRFDIKSQKSFINEAKLATEIEQENVIKLIFFHDGTTDPTLPLYLIMEYANAGTLEKMLQERGSSSKLFTNDQLTEMFLQLAYGMKAINDKMVHRDIKPGNILISGETLKITDFGISKITGANTRTETFKGFASYRYAAPEVWSGSDNQWPMDMYSMGIVFYEIATLKHPYFGADDTDSIEKCRRVHLECFPTDCREYNTDLDIGLSQLIVRMISKPPNQRPNSWDDVIDAIKNSCNVEKSSLVVRQLLDRSCKEHLEWQKAKSDGETKIRNQQDFDNLVDYSFGQIVKEIQKMIDDFNNVSDPIKLTCYRGTRFRLEISASRHSKRIVIVIEPVHEDRFVDNRKIMALGYIKAPSGKGNNLLLLASDQNNLYGDWEWLHIERQAGMALNDNRPEPIPLGFEELSERIARLNDFDKYRTRRQILDPGQILHYLKDWLYEIVSYS